MLARSLVQNWISTKIKWIEQLSFLGTSFYNKGTENSETKWSDRFLVTSKFYRKFEDFGKLTLIKINQEFTSATI